MPLVMAMRLGLYVRGNNCKESSTERLTPLARIPICVLLALALRECQFMFRPAPGPNKRESKWHLDPCTTACSFAA